MYIKIIYIIYGCTCCHNKLLMYEIRATLAVLVSATPFFATNAPEVIVQEFPTESTRAVVVPAATVAPQVEAIFNQKLTY